MTDYIRDLWAENVQKSTYSVISHQGGNGKNFLAKSCETIIWLIYYRKNILKKTFLTFFFIIGGVWLFQRVQILPFRVARFLLHYNFSMQFSQLWELILVVTRYTEKVNSFRMRYKIILQLFKTQHISRRCITDSIYLFFLSEP